MRKENIFEALFGYDPGKSSLQDELESNLSRRVIGTGAICSICGRKVWAGQIYLSGWGNGNETVHQSCNNKRLGI